MAIDKFSPNDIPSLTSDWGLDANDELQRPFSGRAVQKLIREQLSELHNAKFGHVAYDAGVITFYDEDQGTVLTTLPLSGIIYTINLATTTPQIFNVLTSDSIKTISITPSSKEGTIGSELVDFFEDYTWIMSVDSGSGFVNVSNGNCLNGSVFSVDIRPYVKVGLNRIRFSVTGALSNQTKSTVFTANLTSLTLNCAHTWQKALIQGEPYYIQGIYFSGNMQKTLNIRVDDDENKTYTQTFSASTSYVSSPFIFNMTDKFPGTTGIHKVDIWINAPGVETRHFIFDLICVKQEDKLTARLICLNEIKPIVYNYEDQELFQYATYGISTAFFTLSVNDQNEVFPIVSDLEYVENSEEKIPFNFNLQAPTEEQSGVNLTIEATVGIDTQVKVVSVDNSNAFAPVSGADFYLNTSLRTNGSDDREVILNNAIDPVVLEYPAVWSGFAWERDGWTTDNENVRCLAVQAGSSIVSETLKPLTTLSGGNSLTLEWKMKVDNVADYDTPVMSFMSDEVYNAATTNGIIVFPTNITVLSSMNRNTVKQSVIFEENQQLHIMVIFQKEYGTTGRNLCRINVNGVQQCVFEYDGAATFSNGYLRLGQQSTDTYIYMMRYYNNRVFEADSVLKNWLNALTETTDLSRQGIALDNDIYDGPGISYELAKAKGFNTMVVEMDNDIPVPSLVNQVDGVQSTLTLEYNDHPEWNFKITKAPVGGQGTTSMSYYRWNLRWKLAKGTNASVWTYADGSTTITTGWFDGLNNHQKIGRITAKKNIASSSQGHKMGAVGLYHDLYQQLGLTSDLPTGARVSVFQHPVMGFQKYADGSYQFIGLYTIGPDKGDKPTFGYDTNVFPELLSIEGPNHAPLGTRFLHPWIDVEYSTDDETLKFGGEEGWDIAAYNDSNYADAAQVLSLYEAEWKPAYELVYFCSTYLVALVDTGLTLEQINADIITFRNGSNLLGSRRNDVVTLYDENYNLIYFRNSSRQYEILPDHDVITYLIGYLVNQVDPTTADLISARKAKFLAEVGNYFDVEALLYHENFLVLVGASDNHAKNMYPFKLASLAAGGRWKFRQDDLDTVLATDNNGNSTKEYYVEPGDLTNEGTDIYQGSSSVLWTLVREVYSNDRLPAMMSDMVDGLVAMAAAKNILKPFIWQSVYAIFDHYFWKHSAKYFPVRAYDEDATFSYIYVWALNPGTTYNSIPPLTQALGTQLEAEQYWAQRRIIYVFSKYRIGGFTGSGSDGLSILTMTLANDYEFSLTPAINMYPSGNFGGGMNFTGGRTAAGQACTLLGVGGGGTTNYTIKSLDWLTSLGDLNDLVLSSRSGLDSIAFSVSSKRLRSLKVGDENALDVLFNAETLSVSGESLEEIDVRNVKTITATVDLGNCPRLKVAKFEGSVVPTVLLPAGSKVNYLSLPSTAQNIFLNGLPMLADEFFIIPAETYETVRGFYFSNCPNISMLDILRNTLAIPNNKLKYIHMDFGTEGVQGVAEDLTTLASLTTPFTSEDEPGYGRVTYDPNNKVYQTNGLKPYLQGTMNVPTPVYENDVNALRNYFNLLNINVSQYYVWFEDAAIRTIIANNFGDTKGTLESEVQAITTVSGIFTNNITISTFLELELFTGLLVLDGFSGCVNLSLIKFPINLSNIGENAFKGCTGFESIPDIPGSVLQIGIGAFENVGKSTGCGALGFLSNINLTSISQYAFKGSKFTSLDLANLHSLNIIGNGAFYACAKLAGVIEFPDSLETIDASAFENCNKITGLIFKNNLLSINGNAFKGCSLISGILTFPISLITIGSNAFDGCTSVNELIISSSVRNIGTRAFQNLTNASTLSILPGIITLPDYCFGYSGYSGSIVIPNTVTSIGRDCFYQNIYVTGFTIPNSVTSIGRSCFGNCYSLNTIEFPASVTEIGDYSLHTCSGLTSIKFLSVNPPVLIGVNAFIATNNCPIYVPSQSVDTYKAATNWSTIASRIFAIPE